MRFTALLSVIVAAGCATAPQLSEERRNAIRSVSVNSSVRMPPFGIVAGNRTQMQGFWGGALGMGAAMSDPQSPDNLRFRKYVEEHGIDVATIVRQAFIAELESLRAFPAVVEAGGDARFDLLVERYGLGTSFDLKEPMRARLRPNVWLAARLWARDGALLWEHKEQISSWNTETVAYPEDDFYATPGRLEEEFRKVARISARELLKPLKRAR